MKEALVITIDGPAGSGKTTVARALAQRLGLSLLESGAFYRYLTWKMLKDKKLLHNFSSDEELRNYLKEVLSEIMVTLSDNGTLIQYKGEFLKEELRKREVEEKVSEVSAHPLVREEVNHFLRALVSGQRVITEGRDMGSVVFPEARLKIFLTASPEERVRRRLRDVKDRDYEEVRKNLLERDKKDSTREIAPLKIPEGALVIDTTQLTFEEVVNQLENLIRERL